MPNDSPFPRVRAWLPGRRRVAHLAWTGLILWIGTRSGVAILQLFLGEPPLLNAGGSLGVVAVVAAAVTLDEWRRGEVLFHANLGMPPAWPALIGGGVAAVVEACVAAAFGTGG